MLYPWTPIVCSALFALTPAISLAQAYTPTPYDTLHSASIDRENHVTFRLYAPHASDVKIGGPDIPDPLRRNPMVRQTNGVWEVTVGPLTPGAYRYNFIVDDVPVLDPKNPSLSESNMNAWSLLEVPGSDVFDTKNVPHGSISELTYYSTSLKRLRRMHVYTPHGYEEGAGLYPVFYLLHGAWDTDDAWHTVGEAASIFDNLIDANQAVPMIVVMPAGHTGPFTPGSPMETDAFVRDFEQDVRPYVEQHYRVYKDGDHRAIAGLSMGGMQTLDIAIPHLGEYGYIGIFSSGIFELGGNPGPLRTSTTPGWEERNRAYLDDQTLRNKIRLLWFAIGTEDFLLDTSRRTVDLFKRHGFDVVSRETSGGHTWLNWRQYLQQFAPLLFH